MTRSLRLKITALLSLALMASAGIAADAPVTPMAQQPAAASVEQLDDLDEIWVRGRSLSVVIEKAEDDFFKLYNKLNRNNQYDVYCGRMELHPGSMIMVRACTPGFVVFNSYDIMSNTVAYSMGGMDGGSGCNGSFCSSSGFGFPMYPQIPTELLLMEKGPAYEKNLLKVVNSDPRLIGMVKGIDSLYEEMALAQRHYVKVKGVHAPVRKVWKAKKPGTFSKGPRSS